MVMHARKQPRLNDGYHEEKESKFYQYPSLHANNADLYNNRSSPLKSHDPSPRRMSPRYQNKQSYQQQRHGRSDRAMSPSTRKLNHQVSIGSKSSQHSENQRQPATSHDRNSRHETARDQKFQQMLKSAKRVHGQWSEHISSSGKGYFYNCKTEVSQWEKPKDWPDMSVPAPKLDDKLKDRNRNANTASHKPSTNDLVPHSSNERLRSDNSDPDYRPISDYRTSNTDHRNASDHRTEQRLDYRISDYQTSLDQRINADLRNSDHKPNTDYRISSDYKTSSDYRVSSDYKTSSDYRISDHKTSSDSRVGPDYKTNSDHRILDHKISSDYKPNSDYKTSANHKPVSSERSANLTDRHFTKYSVLTSKSVDMNTRINRTSDWLKGVTSDTNDNTPPLNIDGYEAGIVRERRDSSRSTDQQYDDDSVDTDMDISPSHSPNNSESVISHSQHKPPFSMLTSLFDSEGGPSHNLTQQAIHTLRKLQEAISKQVSQSSQSHSSTTQSYVVKSSLSSEVNTSNYHTNCVTTSRHNGGHLTINGGLGTSLNPLSALTNAPIRPPSFIFTPSLTNYYNESLISHVEGWVAGHVERQVSKIVENGIQGSQRGHKVCAELKNARSAVRISEIKSTLHEQRLLFLSQQVHELESSKPRPHFMST